MRTAKRSSTKDKPMHGCGSKVSDVEDVERHQWISDAAYFLAAARGHTPGGALDDRLAAEHEFAMRARKT